MSVALALVASVLWGSADFLGGSASRRLSPLQVLAGSQALAAVVLVAVLASSGNLDPSGTSLWWSLAAGVTWAAGMGALYTALAAGTMGVVAPIASCGMVVPVALSLAAGERPGALQLLGVTVAVAGVLGSAGPDVRDGGPGRRRAVVLALVAAACFGVEIFCVGKGSASSVPMTLLGMRLSALLLVGLLLAARPPQRPVVTAPDLLLLLALGTLDLGATAAYALSASSAMISLVAVLASLYPAVTVVLARQLHGERLRQLQQVGVVTTLLGAVLIGVGGVGS